MPWFFYLKRLLKITFLLAIFLASSLFARYENEKIDLIHDFYTPFQDKKRQSYQSLKRRFVSGFGAYRGTYIKGHLHSGTDFKGKYNEKVYAIGKGKVIDIHLGFPHRTVVILHKLENGEVFFSSYKHIEDIQVETGDFVDEKTLIGRLFNKHELKDSGFPVCHLHFEIRKSFEDFGEKSWSSMNKKELNQYFMNPMQFFRNHIK